MAVHSSVGRSSRLLEFLRTEEASGVFLLAATLVALVWANSSVRDSYEALWSTVATFRIGGLSVGMDLQHWVNEALMTLFFLVVGLEIKREVRTGELRDPKTIALPIFAAIGGMVVPAGVYLLLNAGSDTAGGWGVPVATDIAFALGVLTLAASRAPVSVRSFLLTLAIVDDIGAILLIAIFYSGGLASVWLVISVVIVASVVLARFLRVTSVWPFVLLGVGLWVALYESGVHPTLAGVVLGLMAPAVPIRRSPMAATEARQTLREAEHKPDGEAEAYWIAVNDMADQAVSPLDRVETSLHPWTSWIVVPTFALANAGIELSEAAVTEAVMSPVGLGVLLGLVVGKPLGICAAVFAVTRAGIGRLPDDFTSRMVFGVAVLAGLGFTVALFIAELAFGSPRDIGTAKLAVLLASLLASVLGAVILRSANQSSPAESKHSPIERMTRGHAHRRFT
jgi:Na+:H+ antiporter, NhaA family